MAADSQYSRFAKLSFDSFRQMANDNSLSRYEKIGFPDSYRQGKEEVIFHDLLNKLQRLYEKGRLIMDIGPGCSDLPHMLINNAQEYQQKLVMIDSEEMLAHLPDVANIEKVAAYYPRCDEVLEKYAGKVDVIIVYSVLHYVFAEGNIWEFIDKSLTLLAPGGQMLIGDIPNISKRKRFFSSEAGIKFHQNFTDSNEMPSVMFNQVEEQQIDDAVVLSLLMRARASGFNAYVLPQPDSLPMSNRREDILIVRD
jgi:cyclopropane fatty-acyl-phospholipid synthase-like methyltransferase